MFTNLYLLIPSIQVSFLLSIAIERDDLIHLFGATYLASHATTGF